MKRKDISFLWRAPPGPLRMDPWGSEWPMNREIVSVWKLIKPRKVKPLRKPFSMNTATTAFRTGEILRSRTVEETFVSSRVDNAPFSLIAWASVDHRWRSSGSSVWSAWVGVVSSSGNVQLRTVHYVPTGWGRILPGGGQMHQEWLKFVVQRPCFPPWKRPRINFYEQGRGNTRLVIKTVFQ